MDCQRIDAMTTFADEHRFRELWAKSHGHISLGKLARLLDLNINTIRALRKHYVDAGKMTYWRERKVPRGKTIRCPKCGGRLAYYIPDHWCLGCRVCRANEESEK